MSGSGMRSMVVVATVLALGLAAAFATACRNTAEGVTEDTRLNAEQAREGVQTAGAESREAAGKIGADAKETGSTIGQEAKEVAVAVKDAAVAVKDGAKEVASDVGAGKQTVDVKAALMAAKGIDASHIDVDTDANTKTVTLKGTVPTDSQRTAAAELARDNAKGYRIRNLLTVAKA